ncbi:MAG: hypothetical protein J3K34DRAFT_455827 [Monoraphidium minutum]|nr:MAG: hypothetical protein J3K34DRAFT_455827 [Monoraphidium minutum]
MRTILHIRKAATLRPTGPLGAYVGACRHTKNHYSTRNMDPVEGAAVAAAREAMDLAYGPWTGPGWAPAPFSPAHSHKGRYLWTDAFGVCNFCSLYLETGEERFLSQAEALTAAVHATLGFDRAGAARLGGATPEHPTRGGLRIGKPEAGGADGDGQYLHYLTKWCFALLQLSAAADEPRYLVWALELAEGAFGRFLCLPGPDGGAARFAWKMSADLSRPLVSSSGNLDALDALVTIKLLRAAGARALGGGGGDDGDAPAAAAGLRRVEAAAAALVAPWWWGFGPDDPLDLGEALWLAHWFSSAGPPRAAAPAPAPAGGGEPQAADAMDDAELARACDHVAARALAALEALWGGGHFSAPLGRRLGFRELGATLGVQAIICRAPELLSAKAWAGRVARLHADWRGALTQRDADITPAMWAASVLPRVWIRG